MAESKGYFQWGYYLLSLRKLAWISTAISEKTWTWALVFLHARVLISGVSINIKTWVFYQGWFPRFGFFISRPYAVFYTMKVVFFIKECTFYSFQLFLKLKQWFYHFLSVWQVVVRCNFGFWPLGRVGFEVTFNLIRPVLSFFIKLAEFFYQIAENWSILKGGNLPAKWVIDPCWNMKQ